MDRFKDKRMDIPLCKFGPGGDYVSELYPEEIYPANQPEDHVSPLGKVLNAIADELRSVDLCPIIFDFQKSEEQDIVDTIKTLASMSKFIIADVTNARVIPDELRSIVPDFAVPVVPLFSPSEDEPQPYASLNTLRRYPWVFETVHYKDKTHLIRVLSEQVIKPAEEKHLELRAIR